MTLARDADMATPRSCLYEARVMHARTRPVAHRLEHPVVLALVDLDELPALARRLRLFGWNRRHLVALRDEDFAAARAAGGVRAALLAFLRAGGVAVDDGAGWRFELLAQLRTLGYVFNPVTFTFCWAPGGALACVVAEVRNTFGKVHRHLLDRRAALSAPRGVSYRDDKVMHVSPFFDLDLSWLFHFRALGERLDVAMDVIHDWEASEAAARRGPPLLVARMWGERRPLTDGELARVVARHPLLTARVMAAIHWQALLLWLKGAPFHGEPPYDPEAARSRHARTRDGAAVRPDAAHDHAGGARAGARGAGAPP